MHGALRSPPKEETKELKVSTRVTSFAVVRPDLVHVAGVLPVVLQGRMSAERTYALLDPGSEQTFLTEEMASKLGIEGPRKAMTLGKSIVIHCITPCASM